MRSPGTEKLECREEDANSSKCHIHESSRMKTVLKRTVENRDIKSSLNGSGQLQHGGLRGM